MTYGTDQQVLDLYTTLYREGQAEAESAAEKERREAAAAAEAERLRLCGILTRAIPWQVLDDWDVELPDYRKNYGIAHDPRVNPVLMLAPRFVPWRQRACKLILDFNAYTDGPPSVRIAPRKATEWGPRIEPGETVEQIRRKLAQVWVPEREQFVSEMRFRGEDPDEPERPVADDDTAEPPF